MFSVGLATGFSKVGLRVMEPFVAGNVQCEIGVN
jgi:hypothetical protein